MTQTWNSATGVKEGLLQGLLPSLVLSEMKTFSLPAPVDDDGTDVSLKDWQLGLRSSEPRAVNAFKPSKGSTRARFTPAQPWLDEIIVLSPDVFDTTPTTLGTSRTAASTETRTSSVSPPKRESPSRDDLSLPEVGPSNEDGHNVDQGSGCESPGITFDAARLNDATLDNFSNRGGSLRVSFVDELGDSRSSSPPGAGYRSLSLPKTRMADGDGTDTCVKNWQLGLRRTEPAAVQPALHGDKPREGKDSTLSLSEIDQSHGMSASRVWGSQLRHPSRQARSSLDSIGEKSKYDSAFDFTSSSSGSSYQSHRENTSVAFPDSPPSHLRCNGRREQDEEENKEDHKDLKVGIRCGGGPSDTSISADVLRLVSKLCRLSMPLPEQSASRPSQQRAHNRSNSTPALTSWDSSQINSSLPSQDYKIFGRQNSLKLLCERCSFGPTPVYDLPKPRKIRDPEPYQHFYKPISKALDQKLRS